MARPKKEVAPDNVELILAYLGRALNDQSKNLVLENGSQAAALGAFSKIDPGEVEAVQKWVDAWLTDEARNRMWASFRQKRYKAQHAMRMISLSEEAFKLLSDHANRHKVTLSQAVELLFDTDDGD